jgi:glycosyltransferase involved in cell wall biosynthesis
VTQVEMNSKLSVLMVGASSTRTCGVRDYALVTSEAMRRLGTDVRRCWWERQHGSSVTTTNAEASRFLDECLRAVEQERPHVVLWQYSVFTWGAHGIPFLASRTARRLSDSGIPVVAVLHEFAYPFGRQGARGAVWATSHRVALKSMWHALAGTIVTTEGRAAWLRSRRWLGSKPVRFLPVCSNLPVSSAIRAGSVRETPTRTVGVFGFATDRRLADEVLKALTRLSAMDLPTRLVLVGAPGPTSPAADLWRAAAARAGFASLEFSGILDPAPLADVLASVDAVLLLDRAGPMSRKGTLAAALAFAKPVVAVDGPERWEQLVEERAVVPAAPTAVALSAALRPLLDDEGARMRQAELAGDYYRRWMQPDRLALETFSFLTELVAATCSPARTGRPDPVAA